jgi:hypothetical protein
MNILYIFILFLIIYRFLQGKVKKNQYQTLVVLGSGGHTTEMTNICLGLDKNVYNLEFVLANNDNQSEKYVSNIIPSLKETQFHKIPVNKFN